MPIRLPNNKPTADEFLHAIGDIEQAEVLKNHPRELTLLLEKIERLFAGLKVEQPGISLTNDLAGICINGLPLILLGTNNWMLKQALPEQYLIGKAKSLGEIVSSRIARISANRKIGIVIPEKDRAAIPALSLTISHTDVAIDRASQAFLNAALPNYNHIRIYNELVESFRQVGIHSLRHYDSHFTLETYFRFAQILLRAMGEKIDIRYLESRAEKRLTCLDLGRRFHKDYRGETVSCMKERDDTLRVIHNTGFAEPLSRSNCVVECGKPAIDAKIIIFGDSHASIHGMSKLTHILSYLFRSTTFVWDPFLLAESGPREMTTGDYDFAFFETSQRFVFGNF